jgi:hypothetical protein
MTMAPCPICQGRGTISTGPVPAGPELAPKIGSVARIEEARKLREIQVMGRVLGPEIAKVLTDAERKLGFAPEPMCHTLITIAAALFAEKVGAATFAQVLREVADNFDALAKGQF